MFSPVEKKGVLIIFDHPDSTKTRFFVDGKHVAGKRWAPICCSEPPLPSVTLTTLVSLAEVIRNLHSADFNWVDSKRKDATILPCALQMAVECTATTAPTPKETPVAALAAKPIPKEAPAKPILYENTSGCNVL